ncbi:methylated-DNA--[protein]-cysteine S-methyltransferase [Solirubrobacter sp. CPCC 204708]|nr:methylated-DNA--[protein]-cysteine S-methyltransferase [Solirubrobacter deserti]
MLLTTDRSWRLTGLYFHEHRGGPRPDGFWTRAGAPFQTVRAQLAEYFAGERTTFDVPLAAVGTPFQRTVWDELRAIPYGHTRTYGELAERLGRPYGARAVGSANARNPISIIVPCHRVVAADGGLTGFGGGMERKRRLLELERRAA